MAVQVKHVTLSATGQWWVVNTSPPPGSTTVYTVAEGTQGQAEGLPNAGGISGPYTSAAEAGQVAAGEPQNATVSSGIPGYNISPSGAAEGPLSGVAAIGDFFSRLTQKNTWVRVGEVVVGLILLGIGVNAVFKGRPLAAVTGAAGTVAKVVP